MLSKETMRRSFVTHLECSKTGESHTVGEIHGLSRTGAPLLVRYAPCAQYLKELKSGSESIVLFNCATGLKYPMPAVHNTLNHHKTVDYNSLV